MSAFLKFRCLALIGWVLIWGPPASRAAGENGSDHTARLLLAGLKDGRERLRQGIVVARGKRDPADATSLPKAEMFYTAFDLDADRMRYEVTHRAHFGDRNGRGDPQAPWSSDVTHYYIRRQDKSVTYQRIHERDGPGEITIWPADKPPAPGLAIHDVHAIGLQTALDYARRCTFAESMELFEKRPPTEAIDEGAGVWRLSRTTQFPIAAGRYVLSIDRSRGFSPTRLEEYVRPAAVDPKRINDVPWFRQWTSTAEWVEINGAWVPTTWKIENWKGKNLDWSYTYELEWKSVNEPPPADLFEVDSLNAPDGTLVTNAIGKHPFIERVVGDPDSVLKGTVFGQHSAVKPSRWSRLHTALSVAAAILALMVIWFTIRRRRWTAGKV